MSMLWVVLFVALAESQIGCALPVRTTPYTYPHDGIESGIEDSSLWRGGTVYALPALALVVTAIGLLFGCTWCYRHKDCKLFTASASHLHDGSSRRSRPPDSGFSEAVVVAPASEDNNNGPISLREMQNIANNNALGYIATEEESRDRERAESGESRVEFEPLPLPPVIITAEDSLAQYSLWFRTADENFSRNKLQYLREIGRGWFGRIVEGEIESNGGNTHNSTVAVRILGQNASSAEKAQFLEEGRIYRELRHENVLQLLTYCLNEEPWLLIFELCPVDLRQYLITNRPKMAILNESGVPLRLKCDIGSGLSYMHAQGFVYGDLSTSSVLVRGEGEAVRAVLGRYGDALPSDNAAPELRHTLIHTTSSDVWSLGALLWEICSWGAAPTTNPPLPEPALPCPYRAHLYQVMQLCWNLNAEGRPTSEQVYVLLNHLYTSHQRSNDLGVDDGYSSNYFEERWQRLKPNTIPKLDEHVAIVHVPSTSIASHFTGSDQDFADNLHTQDTLSLDIDTAVSRSSSIMSDRDPLSVHIKSESLTNLHGSLEDVRNIYLIHSENAIPEDQEQNPAVGAHDQQDVSDCSDIHRVDPWLKDIINNSQDDVGYYRDVSDVIKNLDNILNSEKTSSSESSHQASPSRDALTLDCKKDYPIQSSLVKSPGITNFQNILVTTPEHKFDKDFEPNASIEEDMDRETIGTLSHSFERHSETNSQYTDDTLSPSTPLDAMLKPYTEEKIVQNIERDKKTSPTQFIMLNADSAIRTEQNGMFVLVPNLRALCLASVKCSLSSVENERVKGQNEDCQVSCDRKIFTKPLVTCTNNFSLSKSVDNMPNEHKNTSNAISQQVISKNILDMRKNKDLVEREKTITELSKVNESDTSSENFNLGVAHLTIAGTTSDLINSESNKKRTEDELINSDDSTVYMDLINRTDSKILSNENTLDSNIKDLIEKYKNTPGDENDCTIVLQNNSTIYLDLPDIVRETDNLLNCERISSGEDIQVIKNDFSSQDQISSSTPKSISETKNITPEKTCISKESKACDDIPKVEPPDHGPDVTLTKLAQKLVPDNVSPFESPTKSQRTETYDENSSLALGPFDYSSLEFFKGTKPPDLDCIDIPKEEQLAFSSNFAEIDLETPSPLRDSNFLNEVPDIALNDDNDSEYISNAQHWKNLGIEDNNVESPQVKMCCYNPQSYPHLADYICQVYEPTSNFNLGLGSHQMELIKLNLTTRLAMAENENNLNIEQSGPINIEEYVAEDTTNSIEFHITPEDSKIANHVETEITGKELTSPEIEFRNDPIIQNEYSDSCVNLKTDDTLTELPSVVVAGANLLIQSPETDSKPDDCETARPTSLENHIYIVSDPHIVGNGVIGDVTQEAIDSQSELIIVQEPEEESLVLTSFEQEPESYLAGNIAVHEADATDRLTIDDECVQALRNELELKLPLAQGACEPYDETDTWSGELPPPPELVVNYPGALSPIAEETRQQLNAYENQLHWDVSDHNRTDSSESYPEPCNDSTAEVTDMMTAIISGQPDDHTYTIASDGTQQSNNNTYTIQKDVTTTSKELSMSADSLNVSGAKQTLTNIKPIHDKIADDVDKDDCEKLSQVSPYMLSPTTESSIPEPSENDPGVSTISKTTIPSDMKSSKPSETQCLSKATGIDSWCSNDTLFNVEDNFDDLAMDSDVPFESDGEKEVKRSNSTGTLTDHDGEKDISHCSTYIVHDSKSDPRESFTPDSLTGNNHTYTKPKNEDKVSPTLLTSDVNDSSTKNTPTKDLAYGTLISGCNSNVPSHSNCTTEIFSGKEEPWKTCPQVELVRHSTNVEEFVDVTPPFVASINNESVSDSPKLNLEPLVRKMDSVEITYLNDNVDDEQSQAQTIDYHFMNLGNSITSTPIVVETLTDLENILPVSMILPKENAFFDNFASDNTTILPNFQSFLYSAELRPQDISTSVADNTEGLLEAESKIVSQNSGINDSSRNTILDRMQTDSSNFELSSICKPQEESSLGINILSSQSVEGITSTSDEFHQFENSVRRRPQDLSVLIESPNCSKIERNKAGNATSEINETVDIEVCNKSKECSKEKLDKSKSRTNDNILAFQNDVATTNLLHLNDLENKELNSLPVTLDDTKGELQENIHNSDNTSSNLHIVLTQIEESEHEQPHSIIVTNACNITLDKDEFLNNTYESHTNKNQDLNLTYDSHSSRIKELPNNADAKSTNVINGDNKIEMDTSSLKQKSHENNLNVQSFQCLNEENEVDATSLLTENGITNDVFDVSPKNEVNHCHSETNNSKINLATSENYATVNVLKEPFEELPIIKEESNSRTDCAFEANSPVLKAPDRLIESPSINDSVPKNTVSLEDVTFEFVDQMNTPQVQICDIGSNDIPLHSKHLPKVTAVTGNFLENEKIFCQFSTYLPLLGDIKFTGPGSDIMSTSFNQESPTEEPSIVKTEELEKDDVTADILKEWDSDSDDSQSTNSSSGEFIWKRSNGEDDGGSDQPGGQHTSESGAVDPTHSCDSGSGSGSASGSEGDEVEFVPSSWDCLAAPAKSSLRSLEQAQPDNKKRVVFKRQKYHCVYEYPREANDVDTVASPHPHPPYLLPDYSTYSDWDAASAEEAELGYGQLYGRPLQAASTYGSDYDDDFFISSSARPFESLCVLSSSSQFFPGMHAALKAGVAFEADTPLEEYPAPPSPLPLSVTTVPRMRAPSLDFTTPDSGVEDVTPGSLPSVDDDGSAPPWPAAAPWRGPDSASSSESVSPSSPGSGEALGGLRHTRDRLKLDLPPSPLLPSPSPRHGRVFHFGSLEKPRRTPSAETPPEDDYAIPPPPPTFSTFGKRAAKPPERHGEKALILTDEEGAPRRSVEEEAGVPTTATGTAVDSGDEDSGIESSAKAALKDDRAARDVS